MNDDRNKKMRNIGIILLCSVIFFFGIRFLRKQIASFQDKKKQYNNLKNNESEKGKKIPQQFTNVKEATTLLDSNIQEGFKVAKNFKELSTQLNLKELELQQLEAEITQLNFVLACDDNLFTSINNVELKEYGNNMNKVKILLNESKEKRDKALQIYEAKDNKLRQLFIEYETILELITNKFKKEIPKDIEDILQVYQTEIKQKFSDKNEIARLEAIKKMEVSKFIENNKTMRKDFKEIEDGFAKMFKLSQDTDALLKERNVAFEQYEECEKGFQIYTKENNMLNKQYEQFIAKHNLSNKEKEIIEKKNTLLKLQTQLTKLKEAKGTLIKNINEEKKIANQLLQERVGIVKFLNQNLTLSINDKDSINELSYNLFSSKEFLHSHNELTQMEAGLQKINQAIQEYTIQLEKLNANKNLLKKNFNEISKLNKIEDKCMIDKNIQNVDNSIKNIINLLFNKQKEKTIIESKILETKMCMFNKLNSNK